MTNNVKIPKLFMLIFFTLKSINPINLNNKYTADLTDFSPKRKEFFPFRLNI